MEVKINLSGITGLTTATKMKDIGEKMVPVTTVQFQVIDLAPAQLARILNLQRRRYLLEAVIQCPQAEMDLHLVPVNTETGELIAEATLEPAG